MNGNSPMSGRPREGRPAHCSRCGHHHKLTRLDRRSAEMVLHCGDEIVLAADGLWFVRQTVMDRVSTAA
ncbi:MAG TPA: hypothetical protein VFC99_11895 [Acidimicrobiia bacterium]|nr:hypothetical protein [Acidimicrobiia bacterium]